MISTPFKNPSHLRNDRCSVPGCDKAIDTVYPCCTRHRSYVPRAVRDDLIVSEIHVNHNPSKENVDLYHRACDEMVYFAVSEDPTG